MKLIIIGVVCRYYEVKLTSEKTTVKEETVQVNIEEDQRRKDLEKQSRDVVSSDLDSSRTKNIDEPSMMRDDLEEHSFFQKSIITTESFQKNIRDERDNEWSEHGRDESDSAIHKYQTGGGGYSSESWALRAGRSTKYDTSSTLRIHEDTGMISPSPASPMSPSHFLHGGVRCQSVDSEQLNICSHEEKRRFYIRAVIDPRNGLHLSVKEVIIVENFTRSFAVAEKRATIHIYKQCCYPEESRKLPVIKNNKI